MDLAKYDDLIARILDEEHHIYPFLDVIFGFLWRRTDFFVIQQEGGKLGFPPGGAEKIVLSIFKKWQGLTRGGTAKLFETKSEKTKIEDVSLCSSFVREEEVVTTSDINISDATNAVKVHDESVKKKESINCSDVYNGADRGAYRWSQTIVDLEVLIPIPEYIKKSKEVNVSVTDSTLSVKVRDKCDNSKWNLLVDGVFCHKVNKEESIWSLIPGQHISIHCEKPEERWWDALLTCEPKLDTKKIDASRPMSELSEEEQMKVEELMWNEERKQLGLKTSEQIKAENVLKDAWNVEGSPFKGTEFDPTVLNFDNSSFNSIDFQGNG